MTGSWAKPEVNYYNYIFSMRSVCSRRPCLTTMNGCFVHALFVTLQVQLSPVCIAHGAFVSPTRCLSVCWLQISLRFRSSCSVTCFFKSQWLAVLFCVRLLQRLSWLLVWRHFTASLRFQRKWANVSNSPALRVLMYVFRSWMSVTVEGRVQNTRVCVPVCLTADLLPHGGPELQTSRAHVV